jgi:hypothetical protein
VFVFVQVNAGFLGQVFEDFLDVFRRCKTHTAIIAMFAWR